MMVFHTSLLSQMPCVKVLLRYLNSKCILGFCAKSCSKDMEERKSSRTQLQESSETHLPNFSSEFSLAAPDCSVDKQDHLGLHSC